MVTHRKKTGRVKTAEAVENIEANAARSAPDAGQIHSFSRTIAEEHGEKAAVLLQYLAHHVSRSKHIHGGKKWFYRTLDDLAVVFPYLKRSTIHAILQKLGKENGPLVIGDYNKKDYDRTNWFASRDDNIRKQAQSSKPVYFQVEDAVNYGIVAAVLLGNMVHWIGENRKTDPAYTWHAMSPRELAKHLPFPKTTLQTALANLVEANVIKTKAAEVKGGAIEYALVDETRMENREVGGPKLDVGGGSNLDEGGPVLDMGGPKLDMPGPNSDMGGPNLDSNTTLIENPLVDDPLKDPSYVEPGLPDPVSHSPKSDRLKGGQRRSSVRSYRGLRHPYPESNVQQRNWFIRVIKVTRVSKISGASKVSKGASLFFSFVW